jgi:MoxR-like ATPase
MRHRLVLSYEALAEGIGPDDLLTPILDAVGMPDVPLRDRRQPQTTETSWTTGPR